MRIFQACNLEMPHRSVVCTSIQMHDALLARGPYVAIRTESAVRFGAKHPAFKVLPVKLPVVGEPVGIVTLRARAVSPVAQLFSECVREITRPRAKRAGRDDAL
jgi:DNA-binding transcriptional LysR family regulator